MCVRDELIPLLLRLPPDERRDACRQLLDLLSQRPRLQALEPTYAMAPLIAAVGGTEAVTDTFEALQDVMGWWPPHAGDVALAGVVPARVGGQ
jgi:hypothetical protein